MLCPIVDYDNNFISVKSNVKYNERNEKIDENKEKKEPRILGII
jgi:hypothetical protein